MIRASESSTAPIRDVRIGETRGNAGMVELRAETLGRDPSASRFRQFLARAFSVAAVHGVELHAATGKMRIRYEAQEKSNVLRELADAMRSEAPAAERDVRHLYLFPSSDRRVQVQRYSDDLLSTWEVIHRLPGRMRVRHPALVRSRPALKHLASELTVTSGVKTAVVSPRSGTLLVQFDERILTGGALLRTLETSLAGAVDAGDLRHRVSAADLWLASGALALAAAADFFLPVLAPVSAVALVAMNVPNIVDSARELARLRPGLSTLYTTIVGCTLASGLFFPAALMGWFMRFWDRRYHRRFDDARRRWLRPFQVQARYAWLRQPDGSERETPIEELTEGDFVTVRAGETLPVDGTIVEGCATVESWNATHGQLDARQLQAGLDVLAGGRISEGWLRVKVARAGERTRAGSIAALLEQSTSPAPLSLKGHGAPFAKKFVPPTLALAGLGFFVGDLTTTLAVLRPDYATGTGMSAPTGAIRDVASAVREGIVLRDPQMLDDLRRVDLLVVEHTAEQSTSLARVAEMCDAIRRQTGVSVGLVSNLPDAEIRTWRERLNCELAVGDANDERIADLLADYRTLGRRVAFIGNGGANPLSVRESFVAISTGDVTRHEHDPSHAFLLNDDVTDASRLWTFARDRARRHRWQTACTVIPNVACVAGAFALGFTGLHSVLLTNLGVFAAYQAGTRWFESARRQGGN